VIRQSLAFLLISIISVGFAHSGYNLVVKDIEVNNYQLSIYEDTHLLDGLNEKPQLSLFIQLSENKQVPSAIPELTIQLNQSQEAILTENLRDVGIATDNGSTLYQAYILETAIPETGYFDAVLTLTSKNDVYHYPFRLNAQPQADFRFIELIPSLLFILIPLFGLVLIFLNPYLSRKETLHAKQTRFNHS